MREKGRVEMRLGFHGEATGAGFVRAKCKDDRPIKIRRRGMSGPLSGPGGIELSRPRPRLRPGRGEEGARVVVGRALLLLAGRALL